MYYFTTSRGDWDRRFGNLTARKPVIMTEWNYACGGKKGAKQVAALSSFPPYLKEKHVGMTAWSFAIMDTLISDWNYTPTSPGRCSPRPAG